MISLTNTRTTHRSCMLMYVCMLKGQCHEIFCYKIFFMNHLPPSTRVISNFFENSRRYSQVKVHRRYQQHRRQIYLYANSTTQRWPKEIMKTFLIEVFFHLPPVSMTPVVHLELWISDPCRKPKSKISWHCPIKVFEHKYLRLNKLPFFQLTLFYKNKHLFGFSKNKFLLFCCERIHVKNIFI